LVSVFQVQLDCIISRQCLELLFFFVSVRQFVQSFVDIYRTEVV